MARTSYAQLRGPGTFTVDHVREGSRYELSDGHAIYCAPSGGSHASATSAATLVLGTDPSVEEVGTDAGYTPKKDQLRAPDVAVGNVPDKPGWIPGAPRLALEVADVGQDEEELLLKVQDLLEAGTEQVWVLRLVGPRRVEVWRRDGTATLYSAGQTIEAPGVFDRPVLVESLFDQTLAREVALSNLLARHGYSDLEAVRREGRQEGRQEGSLSALRAALRAVVASRGLTLSAAQEAAIDEVEDPATLDRWIREAAVAAVASALSLG